MNIKVVIVWAFSCFLFLSIGIFGYLNRDLLVDSPYNPIEDEPPIIETISKKCVASNDYGDISYTFRINPENNNIEKLFINYKGVYENVEVYESASRINDRMNKVAVNGVNSQIYGTSRDISLNLNVNLLDYDTRVINEINSDLLNLGMIVDNITDYNSYINRIDNALSLTFTCD